MLGMLSALFLALSSVDVASASCALGPHADGSGRAGAADPATYSDVCIGKLRDQGRRTGKTFHILRERYLSGQIVS